MPYVTALAEFREQVRKLALETNSESKSDVSAYPVQSHLYRSPPSFLATPLLKSCDHLRDETLVELGVRLEDKEGRPNLILSSVSNPSAACLSSCRCHHHSEAGGEGGHLEGEGERETGGQSKTVARLGVSACSWALCYHGDDPSVQVQEERVRVKEEQKRKMEEARVRGGA